MPCAPKPLYHGVIEELRFRHLFITNLERAGIRPKMAQALARHSDIRLTLGVYTHVELHDQTAAIGALPGPPKAKDADKASEGQQTDSA